MADARRARPTIRCLVDDLDIELPGLDFDLGDVDHPLLDELRRIAPESPAGQKRVLSIDHSMVYRIRVSSYRGATWVDARVIDSETRVIVWLCAAQPREAGSLDDAFTYFAALHASNDLLPDADDLLRDKAEAAIRLFKGLSRDLIALLDRALAAKETEQTANLGSWLPCRILVLHGEGLEEIWCALSVRGTDDSFISEDLRDLLFAALESHVAPALFEARNDWPEGNVEWFEVVRLGMR